MSPTVSPRPIRSRPSSLLPYPPVLSAGVLSPLGLSGFTGPVPGPEPQTPILEVIGWVAAWAAGRPVLAGGVAAAATVTLVFAAYAARAALWRWRHGRWMRHAQQVTITPPPQVDPAGAAAWWANLAALLTPSPRRRVLFGIPHVGVEYRWAGRALTVVVWLPGTVPAGPVAAAARAAWPGTSTTITPAAPPLPVPASAGRAEGGALAPALPAWYPIETAHDTDPMRALVAAGSGLRATEAACVQLLVRPATPRQVAKLRRGAAALRTGRPAGAAFDPTTWMTGALRGLLSAVTELVTELATLSSPTPRRTHPAVGASTHRPQVADPLAERDARPGLDKTLGPQWEVALRYAVVNTTTRNNDGADGLDDARSEAVARRLTTLAHGLASAYGAYSGRNRLRRLPLARPAAVLGGRVLRRGFLLSAPELAVLAALPTDVAVAGLDRARAKSVPAPVPVPGGGRGTKTLGRAEVGGHAVALPVVDARQHLHVLGSTGSGKSTFLTHLILDDIKARRGVVVIDPKGDLVLDVLDRLPTSVADRLVIIDPDQPGGATFNPLAGPDHDLAVDNVVSIFGQIFARHWGPRIDDVLRVACLTLMRHRKPKLTLVPPLLNDKQFRAPFTVDLDDPAGLKGFWEWYDTSPPALRAQVIAPVLARLRAFLLRDFVLRTLDTAKSSFDMGRVLDGGILLARLPKGQLGEDTAKLMGSFLFASVWQAATARARLPEARRREASVYLDEAHNMLNLAGSVADMLAESRGYHLSLVLAHQNLTQLPRDTQLALSANARNKIFFSCSPEDAHQLARHTLPELDEHDLSHLDAYTAATRLTIASRETAAFTLRTNPPRDLLGNTEAIRTAIARPAPGPESEPEDDPDDQDGPESGGEPDT